MDASDMCAVCVESFKKVRKYVVCSHCKLECCMKCAAKYLETSGVTPQCMQCHRLWNHQYVRANFGVSFVKKMAEVRKSVLFNEQQALFPDTQEYVSLLNQFFELKRKELDFSKNPDRYSNENKNSIGYQRRNVGLRIHAIRNPIRGVNYPGDTITPTKQYIKPCGKGDCKGYVNAEDNTCELCNTEYCADCMEEKCEEHKCKPEDVSTVSMLRKDTKGCPKCAVPIHRISGCLDMFCVSCKTAFNWNTLQINKHGNTNPLYYQWIRDNATGSGVTPNACVQRLDSVHMVNADNFRGLHHTQRDEIMHIIIRLHHYEEGYDIKKFYKEFKKTKQYNHSFRMITLDRRADYLNNKLTKEKFTQFLLRMNKAIEYNSHIDDIVNCIGQFRQSLLQMIVYSTKFDYDTFVLETKNFVEYINKCVLDLEEVFYTKKDFTFLSLLIQK